MNGASSVARSDSELLRIAESVLAEQDFHVEVVNDGIELVLAENSYFVVAVASTNTIKDLVLAEPVAVEALAQRIEAVALGPKKWDTYLVLLTQARSSDDDNLTRDLYAINYDTSRLRRIAHTGVDPTRDAVAHALAPFVEPPTSPVVGVQADAFAALQRALVSRGIDSELAQRAIMAFEKGAALDDVL